MLNPLNLRSDLLAQRDNLSTADIQTKSAAIEKNLLKLPQIIEAQCIFTYVSFRSEVATLDLIDKFLSQGKTVTVPITRVKEKRLDAIRIFDRDKDLVPGYCGIPEPKAERCETHLVSPEMVETILLPGSVFDRRGGRFGYGGGYYDRFLESVPQAVRIGLAFDQQIVDLAPLQPHDELLDFVITETAIIAGER